VELLKFQCSGCGNCCRALRVAVTALDVARLAAHTQKPASELVDWLAPDAVDMSGEPASFVELSAGRRLMVLAQSGGACRLLGADDRCTAYAARPQDCRLFPFNPSFGPAPRSELRRLELLPLSSCEYTLDGQTDAAELAARDRERWRELAEYQAQVERWNRLAKHRRRLGQRVGSGEVFLTAAIALHSKLLSL
jgi:Fe-S-cluster containining protein